MKVTVTRPVWVKGNGCVKHKISPCPSLLKRGILPPFGKGREGGILSDDIFTVMRLLINGRIEVQNIRSLRPT
jgi:hypothetical protein